MLKVDMQRNSVLAMDAALMANAHLAKAEQASLATRALHPNSEASRWLLSNAARVADEAFQSCAQSAKLAVEAAARAVMAVHDGSETNATALTDAERGRNNARMYELKAWSALHVAERFAKEAEDGAKQA